MANNIEFNGYTLSRTWFTYCLENPETIKPNHTALYFWIIETFNRFEWKQKVGLPTDYAMEVLGIKSYNTYIDTLTKLVDLGFIIMVEKSKNQYSANIIALSNFNKARVKATLKHIPKQSESTVQSTSESICSITKPINLKTLKPINLKTKGSNNSDFSNPTPLEIDFKKLIDFFNENKGNMPEVQKISKTRQIRISNLIKNYSKEKLKDVILKCKNSNFIQGENDRDWIANFDWITKSENFIKILEGNYKNKENGSSKQNTAESKQPVAGRQSAETIAKNLQGW